MCATTTSPSLLRCQAPRPGRSNSNSTTHRPDIFTLVIAITRQLPGDVVSIPVSKRYFLQHARRVPIQTTLATSLGLSLLRPAAAASFATSAAVIDQVTFREMGMLSWLIIDFAIQWGGWAVSTLLKVCMQQTLFQHTATGCPGTVLGFKCTKAQGSLPVLLILQLASSI